jgi:hypothetical protein
MGSDIDGTNNQFGYSVSLSGDGETIAIGERYYSNVNNVNYYEGAVSVYSYNGTEWVRDHLFYGEAGNDYFGWSVALSTDATRLIAGAPNNKPGYAHIFTLTDENPNISKLRVVGEDATLHFGTNVNINSNGTQYTISGHTGTGQLGGAITLEWNFNEFGHPVQVNASHVTYNLTEFGQQRVLRVVDTISVDDTGIYKQDAITAVLSKDASTLVTGRPYDNNTTGYPYYTYKGNISIKKLVNNNYVEYLTVTGDATSDNLGASVDISRDGHRITVAATGKSFERTGSGITTTYNEPYVRVYGIEFVMKEDAINALSKETILTYDNEYKREIITYLFTKDSARAKGFDDPGQLLSFGFIYSDLITFGFTVSDFQDNSYTKSEFLDIGFALDYVYPDLYTDGTLNVSEILNKSKQDILEYDYRLVDDIIGTMNDQDPALSFKDAWNLTLDDMDKFNYPDEALTLATLKLAGFTIWELLAHGYTDDDVDDGSLTTLFNDTVEVVDSLPLINLTGDLNKEIFVGNEYTYDIVTDSNNNTITPTGTVDTSVSGLNYVSYQGDAVVSTVIRRVNVITEPPEYIQGSSTNDGPYMVNDIFPVYTDSELASDAGNGSTTVEIHNDITYYVPNDAYVMNGTTDYDSTRVVKITVNQGWNLISYRKQVKLWNSETWTGVIWEFNGVQYTLSNNVKPGKGYWVNANKDGQIWGTII